MNEKISVIICAAGKGERAGFGKNKLLAPLYGAPALWHTLKKFNKDFIHEVVVTSSETDFNEISALCKPFGYSVVLGGETRTQSVKNALNEITGDIVLIHDGARPFVTEELILKCIQSVQKFGSGVCALKSTDTVVSAAYGQICGTLDRNEIFRVQTPQGFLTEDIKRAYALAGDGSYTDDSAVYCEYICPARIVEGDENNVKLTYKSDYQQDMPQIPQTLNGDRVGFGVDAHTFCDGNGLMLGGVKVPFNKSFAAHSDGDVIIHALMDALLSAAGLKDIGHYFPTDDKNYDGADSKELLKKVIKILYDAGYAANNVSLTVQAERPRLSPFIDKMKKTLCSITGVNYDEMAIAAGTCEGLGFVGEGRGAVAYCAVTLRKLKNGKN